jgi:hypothetical protein
MALVKLVFAGTPAGADTVSPAALAPSTPAVDPVDPDPVDQAVVSDTARTPAPSTPARPAAVVPVQTDAFTRLNGSAVMGPVSR